MIAENAFPLALLLGLLGLTYSVLLWRVRSRRSVRWVVVDGSNVMHWRDGTPDISAVRAVLHDLHRRGFRPSVVFDANAGYLLSGRYRNSRDLGQMLGLPERHVLVVPKGVQADGHILATARALTARVVTNDRYRDWADTHPEVRDPGHLIRGGQRDGAIWLDL